MLFVQPNPDGTIAQIAEGYDQAPFENAVPVPDSIAFDVRIRPHRWRYISGGFMQVDEPDPVVNRPTDAERLNKLERQMAKLIQRLGLSEQDLDP